jgi:hypothetical protein
MDVSDASYYIQENNENKGSRMGHTKKNILKKGLIRLSWIHFQSMFLYYDNEGG